MYKCDDGWICADVKSRRREFTDCTAVDISIHNTSKVSEAPWHFKHIWFVEQLWARHPPPPHLPPPPPPAPLPQGCLLQKHLWVQTESVRLDPRDTNTIATGANWELNERKNQLCQNPLLTISAGEGAFSCFCCGWLFWEWHPRQLGLFVWLLSSVLIVTARRGITTNIIWSSVSFTADKLRGHEVET